MLSQTCPNWTVLGEQEKLPKFQTPALTYLLIFVVVVPQMFIVFQVHTLCYVLGIQYKFPQEFTFGLISHGIDSVVAQKNVLI